MTSAPQPQDLSRIYFSDVFEVSPEILEQYGAFDVSLINDLPLFIDPFLIFNSTDPEYQALHEEVIKYVRFLRDKSVAGAINDGLLEAWFTFREVRQNWFGYSLDGNGGHGLGMKFARAFNSELATIFSNFGVEGVTKGSHIEKICLVGDGVGRDNISDFATNLIKHYLLEYSEAFAKEFLRPDQRALRMVSKAAFNFKTESWESRQYELPFANGDYVILTPIDLLNKDENWINKDDMIEDYARIVDSIPNVQLRSQINNYFGKRLSEIQKRDAPKKERKARPRTSSRRRGRRQSITYTLPEPTQKQVKEAAVAAIHEFPAFIDYFIRYKEEHGDDAERRADERVRSSERLYVGQVRQLVAALLQFSAFYSVPGDTLEEARLRVDFLKDVIENKGGWRIFYVGGEPVRKESDVHILFRLTWCNTPSDVNREVNNGRGPSDFEVSRGRFDKSIVEFKLAKNTGLAKNLQHQVEIYKKASDAQAGLKVIVYFTAEERIKVIALLKALKLDDDPNIILIDARSDNKQSASKVDGTEKR